MAMTKKELAEVEALKTALALRFTDADERPDIPSPGPGEKTTGWRGNSYSGRAELMWSEFTSHGNGSARSSRLVASQGGIPLHSSKERALRAMRREVERRCAKLLREIDVQIHEAEHSDP